MATQLIDLKDAAKMLGITADELNDMRSRSEIFGYRDGATWKFKMDEIERAASSLGVDLRSLDAAPEGSGSGIDDDLNELFDADELQPAGRAEELGEDEGADDEADSILVSEEELGHSGETTSSTIIGAKESGKAAKDDSDIKLADLDDDEPVDSGSGASDVALVPETSEGSDVRLVAGQSDVLSSTGGSGAGSHVLGDGDKEQDASDTADMDGDDEGGGISDLGLVEDDLSLGDDDLTLGEDIDLDEASGAAASAVDLDADDDDDLVLGSGVGSDVTKGTGDSGISLASPTDSGLNLEEEPVDLGLDGSAVESLELGEDDMVSLEEEADPEAATQLKADDDFLLTPVEDMSGEESDSGSQVIALDTEEFDESSDTMLGQAAAAPLLEDEANLVCAAGAPIGTTPQLAGRGGLAAPQAIPEAPYSIWNVLSLMVLVLMMSFTGIMMVDLLRNMWSWGGTYQQTSPIMDEILKLFGS